MSKNTDKIKNLAKIVLPNIKVKVTEKRNTSTTEEIRIFKAN
jgi:hypothetical protein